MKMLKIGDKIKDTEDGDCYFVGEIVKLNKFGGVELYKVTQVIWNGEDYTDDNYIGLIIEPKWWYIQLFLF
jgi:hypothetical protein